MFFFKNNGYTLFRYLWKNKIEKKKNPFLQIKYCYYYSSKIIIKNSNKNKIENKNESEYLKGVEETTDNEEDYFFKSKYIEPQIVDIKIKDSHNPLLFEYLPKEGRTNNAPLGFRIIHYALLFIFSAGVFLIHVLSEIEKEEYIRDLLSFQIYLGSCVLAAQGGLNSLLQLIQYSTGTKRKNRGFYNSLRFISSLIPLFFSLVSTTLSDQFPKDSLFLLAVSYISLLFNSYFLYVKCLIPVWLFRQYKIICGGFIFNILLLFISEAQLYKGRGISLHIE